MKRNLTIGAFILGCCVGVVLVGVLSSRKVAAGMPVHMPPHSVLLTIDEVNAENGVVYQATITTPDTQLVSPQLISRRDLMVMLARQGKIYMNICTGAHKKLFKTLRTFIESAVEPNDTIYMLLNGESWNLAVEAIPLETDDAYMCDKYNFKRISSVKHINRPLVQPNSYQTILFGAINYNSPKIKNLPGSRNSIAYLSELFPSKGLQPEIYSQERATEEAFRSISGRHADNMLVSTHGEIRAQADNTRAYEVLFDNAIGVSAPTIAKMDLSHIQTIFFTACHSANYSSDDAECLRTALKAAGANSLIFHIWPTYDRAAEIFMKTFYTAWLNGQSQHEAFLTAKYTVRAQMDEPQYWAGFVMLD